ncbi:MAG: tetratricopeptide repeat protein, partial [Chitinophagaceae bacterium]
APGDFMSPGTDLVQKMKKHYQEVSKEMGYKVSPPEMAINGLGYYALSQKHYDKAVALFEMNIENYPQSGNVYDSYADALLAKKDTAGAITHYEKAWAITKSEDSKQKIDQLKGKSTFTVTAKDLAKYVAAYAFEGMDVVATIVMKGDALWVSAPGQGDYQLVPLSLNTFTLKGVPGYTLKFETDGDKPVSLTAIQPNGTFKAHIKN